MKSKAVMLSGLMKANLLKALKRVWRRTEYKYVKGVWTICGLDENSFGTKYKQDCFYLLTLIEQLLLQPEFEDSLESLCGFVRRQLRRAATEKFEVEREACHPPVPIPYLFLTPKVTQQYKLQWELWD